MSGLTGKLASGAAWMIIARFATRGIGVINTLILARVLMPEDFGLVAMATSLVALIELLRAFGFDTALIQKQDAGRAHYDTAWTFNAVFGLAAALTVCALAFPAAVFYEDGRVIPLMLALAGGVALQGFENVGVVDFRKYLRFDREFVFAMSAKVVAFAATVSTALWLRNYWALAIGVLVGRFWSLVSSFWMHPYRPSLSFAARRELLGFSKWLLLNNFLLYLKSRASDFVIGRILGPRSLGLFNLSDEISNLPTTEIVMPINRAVYSGYAQIATDRARLRGGFLNVISVITTFAIPAGAGIAATAPWLVPLLLGPQWLEAIPLIQVLAPYGVVIAMQTNTLYVYIALGEPRTATMLNGLHVLLLVPLLIQLATLAGAMGAAWACLAVAIVTTPINLFVLVRRLQLDLAELFRVVWRPVLATAAMLITLYVTVLQPGDLPAVGASLFSLVIGFGAAAAVGAGTYAVVLWLLWLSSGRPPGIEAELRARVLRR